MRLRIDPDTFQSKFYPLLLMCLNPSLQRVKFVLEFIRYGASRSVEYTRQDVPWPKELAERERARQQKLHEIPAYNAENVKASPGRHCTWCPLLLNGCPVSMTNPYAQMTAGERLRFALWLQEAEKQNTKLLKDLMVERGPVHYWDENQAEYGAALGGGRLPSDGEEFSEDPRLPGPVGTGRGLGPHEKISHLAGEGGVR
ncbi:MAG: hypothetical protein L0387_28790 [Acidobacteria bacterium]|nr:hypothetical protein [Acidobacteriota bacterium]